MSDTSAPPQVRKQAAANLIETNPARGTEAVLALIERGGRETSAMKAAVIEMGSLVHHNSKVPAELAHKVHHLLAGTASNTRDAQAPLAAIALAEMLDPNAQKHLTALLKTATVKGPIRAQVVAAMSLSPAGAAPTLREILEKALRENDTETSLAALRALAGDQDSRALRLKLTEQDDDNVDPLINRAAMRSLMHETVDVMPKLLVYLEGPTSTADPRKAEAAGAFRVAVESFKPFPRPKVDDWKVRIRTVSDGAPPAATEFKTALAMALEVLEEAAN
jgi:hypothetical protein